MIANYHTHTPRCHHAVGTEREYITSAQQAGLKILGFSDHTPYPFKDGYYSNMRMYPEQLPEYMNTLRVLQADYKDTIQIHAGLEAEYYPAHFQELLSLVRDNDVQYMILGQHWLGNEQGEEHVTRPFEDPARLERYCDQTIEGIYTGVFSYVAHPDYPNFLGEDHIYSSQMKRLIRAANACGLPLEINLHGAQRERNYPNRRFWELVAEEGAQVVLGRDAHAPEELLDVQTQTRMENMAKELGLSLLQQITLIKP